MNIGWNPLALLTIPRKEEKKGLEYGWCQPLALREKALHVQNKVVAFVAQFFAVIADLGIDSFTSLGYNVGAFFYNNSMARVQNFFIERRNAKYEPLRQTRKHVLYATAFIGSMVLLGFAVRYAIKAKVDSTPNVGSSSTSDVSNIGTETIQKLRGKFSSVPSWVFGGLGAGICGLWFLMRYREKPTSADFDPDQQKGSLGTIIPTDSESTESSASGSANESGQESVTPVSQARRKKVNNKKGSIYGYGTAHNYRTASAEEIKDALEQVTRRFRSKSPILPLL